MGNQIQFPHANVPIVGQAFKMKTWLPVVNIVCNCEAQELVTLAGVGTVAQCASCRRAFTVATIQFNAQAGQSEIGIAVAVPPQEKQPS